MHLHPTVGCCLYEIKGPSCLEPQELSLVPLYSPAIRDCTVFDDSSTVRVCMDVFCYAVFVFFQFYLF
jgi:hypothetical protein